MQPEPKKKKGWAPWALLALGFYFGLAGAHVIGGMMVLAGVLILIGG